MDCCWKLLPSCFARCFSPATYSLAFSLHRLKRHRSATNSGFGSKCPFKTATISSTVASSCCHQVCLKSVSVVATVATLTATSLASKNCSSCWIYAEHGSFPDLNSSILPNGGILLTSIDAVCLSFPAKKTYFSPRRHCCTSTSGTPTWRQLLHWTTRSRWTVRMRVTLTLSDRRDPQNINPKV